MTQDTQNVPHWFADFAVKNADEHAALAKEIANVALKSAEAYGELKSEIARAETRTTRWTAGAVATGVLIILGALTVAVAVILNFG